MRVGDSPPARPGEPSAYTDPARRGGGARASEACVARRPCAVTARCTCTPAAARGSTQ